VDHSQIEQQLKILEKNTPIAIEEQKEQLNSREHRRVMLPSLKLKEYNVKESKNVKAINKSAEFQSTLSVRKGKSKVRNSIKLENLRHIIVPLSANELLRKI